MTKNSQLREAVCKALRAANVPSLRVADFDKRENVDWRRLLSGRSLDAAEVAAGMAVPRRLLVDHQDISLSDMPRWLRRQSGSVLLLHAEAGEGKTTYLKMLEDTLQESCIVLTWLPERPLLIEQAVDIGLTARSLMMPPPVIAPPIVILSELPPLHRPSLIDQLVDTLRDYGGQAIILIAGRPGPLGPIDRKLGAQKCYLSKIANSAICNRIRQAHAEISKVKSSLEIDHDFPNLKQFLELSPTSQRNYFPSGDPLIVGLLRAVYGVNFVDRLIDEYEALEELDKYAYLQVCLGTATGTAVPESTLQALAPNAALDERSRYDPWVRVNDNEHAARHALIAQTVVEESKAYAHVSECFSRWTEPTKRCPEELHSFFHIVAAVAYWETISGMPSKIVPVQRRLVDVIAADTGLVDRVVGVTNSAAKLLSWSTSVRRLISTNPPIDELSIAVLDTVQQLLVAAAELGKSSDRVLAERIEYRLDCAERDRWIAQGADEPFDDIEERLQRWSDFIGRNWANARFYEDLLTDAAKLARHLTFGTVLVKDSDALYRAYLCVGLAYQYLYVADKNKARKFTEYSSDRLAHDVFWALPTRALELYRKLWDTSRELQTFASPGLRYAHELLSLSAGNSDEDNEFLDEAITVFQTILDDISACDLGALSELAWISGMTRRDLRSSTLERLNRCWSRDLVNNPYRRAALHSAAAMVEDEDNAREHLEAAAVAFCEIKWNRSNWARYRKYWEYVAVELEKIGLWNEAWAGELKRNQLEFRV